MIKFKRVQPTDTWFFENMTLRTADINELRASSGLKDPVEALRSSLAYSTDWIEVCYDGETGEFISLFGLGGSGDLGVPWMVGSPRMLQHRQLLMRYSKKVIAEMLEVYPRLCNLVDSRNTVHINWLKHMGFTFTHPGPVQLNGYDFEVFQMER